MMMLGSIEHYELMHRTLLCYSLNGNASTFSRGGLILGCPNRCEVFTLIGVYFLHPNHVQFGSCFLDSWVRGSTGVIEKLHIKLLNQLLTYKLNNSSLSPPCWVI